MQQQAFLGYEAGAWMVARWREDGTRLANIWLAVGDWAELWIAGGWQWAQVCSGGGNGRYYQAQAGQCGRFAIGMRVLQAVCCAKP